MKSSDLNSHIKNYVENNKSQSAIMLTSAWGTGKSYYVHNVLEPFLKNNTVKKCRCVVVSLYGLKDVYEISKRIYFELRTLHRGKKSEALSTGKVVAKIYAKTVLNGITNMIGFNIGNISGGDLREVYTSVDLSNVLVVLEDLERSNIDIVEILGYINSLVEQDNAKVLVVANEDDIIKFHKNELNGDSRHTGVDKTVEAYLNAKEKTISDTFDFEGDRSKAISSIINSFGDDLLCGGNSYNHTDNITQIMQETKCYNLRLFSFACQKTVEIYKLMNSNGITGNIFREYIFYGVVALSLRKKDGEYPDWDTENYISTKLGSMNFPLYRFCYDYVKWHTFDKKIKDLSLSEHAKIRLLRKNSSEGSKNLSIIRNFSTNKEVDVRAALLEIENHISQKEYIAVRCYEELICCLIRCKTVLGYDYSTTKKNMVNFLRNNLAEMDITDLFHQSEIYGILTNENEKREYEEFVGALVVANKTEINLISGFAYNPKEIELLYKNRNNLRKQAFLQNKFISNFNLDKIVKMILMCSAYYLDIFRELLLKIYEKTKYSEFEKNDIEYMESLTIKLKEKRDSPICKLDMIQKYQVSLLIEALLNIIRNYS